MNPQEKQNVVTVCGNEARVYGAFNGKKRPYLTKIVFNTHGAAKMFAQDYEDKIKASKN